MVEENQIKIDTLKQVLKDLKYQRDFLSNLPNQKKAVSMSIDRIKDRLTYLNKQH